MESNCEKKEDIFIVGDEKLAFSVVANSLRGGHKTILLTNKPEEALETLKKNVHPFLHLLTLVAEWPSAVTSKLAIVLTEEEANLKSRLIQQLECCVPVDTIIAVNTESISIDELQKTSQHPTRIIGLNWCYPADQTFFLEIIANSQTDSSVIQQIENVARKNWGKDPYTVYVGFSVRARLFAAMVREAFYLVDNGYATIDSVDRSCRNDAGYYLSFAGNFRYMDLMGTGGYGVVMETLNKELADQREVSDTIKELVKKGDTGMHSGAGFYSYAEGDLERWEDFQRQFGVEIKKLMETYPITFDYEIKRKG